MLGVTFIFNRRQLAQTYRVKKIWKLKEIPKDVLVATVNFARLWHTSRRRTTIISALLDEKRRISAAGGLIKMI